MITTMIVAVATTLTPPGGDDLAAFRSYRAHLAAAEKALRLGEANELRRWLDDAPTVHRDWEWRYLRDVSDTTLETVAIDTPATGIAVAPDGATVATIEGDRVWLRDWPSLSPRRVIDGHAGPVYRAAFGPGGDRLITVSRDVTSRVWDTATGEEIARITLANPAVAAATLGPGGAAATGAWERDEEGKVHGVVWIWDPATNAVRFRRRIGIKPLSSLRFTPDGSHLLAGSWDGLVHVLDATGVEQRVLRLPDEGVYNAVNDIAISPDGAIVAAAAKDRTVRIFDIETGGLIATLRGHGDHVEAVAFSPDGALLASGARDETVRRWRVADWSEFDTLRGHEAAVRGVAWTPAGDRLLATGRDATVRVWDGRTKQTPHLAIDTGTDGTYSALFAPDGNMVAVTCFDGWLRTYDTRTGAEGVSWEAHPGASCHGAGFDRSGTRLITCSWDQTARIWSMPSPTLIATLDAGAGVYACALAPDGKRAALSAGHLQIWDVEAVTTLHRIELPGVSVTRVVFSPDGTRVLAGGTDGIARLYDAETGALVGTFAGTGSRIEAVAFAPSGTEVLTGDAAGVVRLHATSGGPAQFACVTGERGVNHIAVFGDRVAVATDRLWLLDRRHGETVLMRRPLTDTAYHLSWSADGQRIAIVSANGTLALLGREKPGPGTFGP
ncbi:MAG: WD40 repeat domain-containing protein [Phycisphaerales bacterium]|nr:WD40 repeat domain-containing protein [Phycisphaerae bacterium]NNF43436.1 WD40 repeat domain-containing protein [Phycisphaerales bacterium]NNM26595.1 WD40 repeat domain-containing protein [Phycisphaerales bacterium]